MSSWPAGDPEEIQEGNLLWTRHPPSLWPTAIRQHQTLLDTVRETKASEKGMGLLLFTCQQLCGSPDLSSNLGSDSHYLCDLEPIPQPLCDSSLSVNRGNASVPVGVLGDYLSGFYPIPSPQYTPLLFKVFGTRKPHG